MTQQVSPAGNKNYACNLTAAVLKKSVKIVVAVVWLLRRTVNNNGYQFIVEK